MSVNHQGKAQTLSYSVVSKNVMTPEEAELYELCRAAGVIMDSAVLKIIVDLLKWNVAPTAIMQMLKHIRKQSQARTGSTEIPTSATRGRQSSTDRGITRRDNQTR